MQKPVLIKGERQLIRTSGDLSFWGDLKALSNPWPTSKWRTDFQEVRGQQGPVSGRQKCEETPTEGLTAHHSNTVLRLLQENCLSNWLFPQTSLNEAKLHSQGAHRPSSIAGCPLQPLPWSLPASQETPAQFRGG